MPKFKARFSFGQSVADAVESGCVVLLWIGVAYISSIRSRLSRLSMSLPFFLAFACFVYLLGALEVLAGSSLAGLWIRYVALLFVWRCTRGG